MHEPVCRRCAGQGCAAGVVRRVHKQHSCQSPSCAARKAGGARLCAGAAEDLAAMFRYYREARTTYSELRDPKRAICQGPTFREWATANRDALTAKVSQ